jgi:hypothetical protein
MVLAWVPDLMDRSRLTAACPDVRFARDGAELVALVGAVTGESAAAVVVVDLARPGALDVVATLRATPARVVAYGSHVDRELLAAARGAGADTVLARSALFAGLPGTIGRSGQEPGSGA